MFEFKIKSSIFIDVMKRISSINNKIQFISLQDRISFVAIDPMGMAAMRIDIPKNKLSNYKYESDEQYLLEVKEISDDMSDSPSGYIYVQMKDKNNIIFKTKYYTTNYDIKQYDDSSLKIYKFLDGKDDTIKIPSGMIEFIRLLKRRNIDKITIKDHGHNIQLIGNGKKIYSTILDCNEHKSFGMITTNVLWLSDVIGNSDSNNLGFSFTSMMNMFIVDKSEYDTYIRLSGTATKINIPEDIPDINTEIIDKESQSDWGW